MSLSQPLPRSPLTDHISQTARLANQMLDILRQVRPATLPPVFYEGINGLATRLSEAVRLAKEVEDERLRMRSLANIGQVVNSSLDVDTVLRIVMDTIIRLTNAERGFLMLRGNSGDLSIRVARNWEQESIPSSDFAISRTVINRVTSEGQAILTTNAQEDPRFGRQESIIAHNLRSILCVPLKVKEQLTGLIYADNRIRSGIFTENDRELLNAFANQAAVAIENASLFASVRQTLDEVTELKNLMDNIFFSIASGVITADIEDKITLCNRAAESILGYTGGGLIGQALAETLPPLGAPLQPHLEHVRDTDQPIIGLELTSHLPSRGQVDLRLNLSPLKDADSHTQGVAIVVEDLTEKKQLEAQRRLFERMVSPAVINQLNPDHLQLGGSRSQITVLFADIRSFTGFSERIDPERLVSVLNRHLAAAAEAILAQEGTIDKFLGDAVMAWFNAPIPQVDHTYRAACAALQIRKAIEEVHASLPPDLHLSFGVGIHVGEAVLGLVGTERRLEYTAIGDCVNTAKRIQENAAPAQILISADTYARIQHQVHAIPIGDIQVKGKRDLIPVYELHALREN